MPIIILRRMSCHLLRTQVCRAVQIPHIVMTEGTQTAMPYFLPNAAPTGCNDTKKAKNMATAVLRSSGSIPTSFVKSAVYARVSTHTRCRLYAVNPHLCIANLYEA